MHDFPLAAVTNYHKVSDLQQNKFINLQFHRLEVRHSSRWVTIKVATGRHSFLEALGGEFCSLAFSSFWRLPAFLASWPLVLSSKPGSIFDLEGQVPLT